MSGTFLFLGTGGSMGIPVIGCDCAVCQSHHPKNNRTRSGGLLTIGEKRVLIDASQDLRSQALKHRIEEIDLVIFTHSHHDHVAGIDDLRPFFFGGKGPLPCYLSEETHRDLTLRYSYIFKPKPVKGALLPKFDLHLFEGDRGTTSLFGKEMRYFTYLQSGMKVNGFKIGNFAYLSDIKDYPETLFEDIAGAEILVLSALRDTPSTFHFTVEEAVAFAEKAGARETWLTHIAHDLDHEKTEAVLPENVRLAYDGLQIQYA